MDSKIAKRITTNPKAMMDFHLMGKVPSLKSSNKTPLWILLSKISPRDRLRIMSIRLSPKLGYNSSATFGNAEQLFRWLGGNEKHGDWEHRPCDSCSINSFRGNISVEVLFQHCKKHPEKISIR